ncbi:MAG: DUF2071 domain-containing protein [Bradymonadaceae bacterium]|nr:DUF2071 domain-containing protein [Lujinxingiaceae bacterium]
MHDSLVRARPVGRFGVLAGSGRWWPTPRHPWVMHMQWHDLLFAHWTVDPDVLRPHLPAGLELDLWDGQAYVGVVPFGMKGVRGRGLPAVPSTGEFLECNVRTYVTAEDKPGVFFFSLDAESRLAVRAARWSFGLPYFDAEMAIDHRTDGAIDYSTRRTHKGAPAGEFKATYGPSGDVFRAEAESLDFWLTERYCLYSSRGGSTLRAEIDHQSWPLQRAVCEIQANTVAEGFGLHLKGPPLHLHFVRFLDVRAWLVERVQI